MLNGHLPEGAKLVTLDLLQQANTTHVKAPILSERAGQDVYVRIRTIRRAVYLAMLPPAPPGSEAWPVQPEERARLYEAWLATLPEERRAARQQASVDIVYKVLVAGMVEPAVTLADGPSFGDDADVLAVEILQFSGLLPKTPESSALPKTPAPAPVEVAQPA